MLTAVALVMAVVGLAGWGLARQLDHLAEDLPRYRTNIFTKIADVRIAGKGGSVEKLQETIDDIKSDLEETAVPRGAISRPRVVVTSEQVAGWAAIAWLGPMVGWLGTAGLVLVLVLFMRLERRSLRDRLIGLIGHGRLTTTKALDEAGARVSRQLLMQSVVSLAYGAVAGVALYFLGVPYALVWGALGGALRFIPYLGPVMAAGAPIAVSLAALPGWAGPLSETSSLPAPRACRRLRCSSRWYSGRGCGDRSGC